MSPCVKRNDGRRKTVLSTQRSHRSVHSCRSPAGSGTISTRQVIVWASCSQLQPAFQRIGHPKCVRLALARHEGIERGLELAPIDEDIRQARLGLHERADCVGVFLSQAHSENRREILLQVLLQNGRRQEGAQRLTLNLPDVTLGYL